MKTTSTFTDANWDFNHIWLQRQDAYPMLRWQLMPGDLSGDGNVGMG
jgi:hypothetical protein